MAKKKTSSWVWVLVLIGIIGVGIALFVDVGDGTIYDSGPFLPVFIGGICITAAILIYFKGNYRYLWD